MRKIILSAFLVAASTALFAQKLDDIQEKIQKGKFAEARQSIDQVLSDPKNQNTANAWYYKGVVYSELAKDSTKQDMDYNMEAFTAFKKYQELDPKNIMLTLNQNGNFFQLYESYYNHGIKAFNTKSYERAFSDFENALKVKDYVYAKGYEVNGFKFAALDTQLVNLAGSAGMLAKKDDAAIPYFQLIADQKLKGDDFKDVYPIIVDYYTKKKDSVNRAKYLAIGMEVLPANPYWTQSKLQEAGDDKGKRLAQFQELLKNDPANHDLLVDYAVELFNYTYGKEKPADYTQRQAELTIALQNAINSKPNSTYANYIMTQHLSNQVYDMQQDYNAIKSTKPEDIKKKQAMNKDIEKKSEEMFAFSDATYKLYDKMTELKAADKANFRNVTNQMVDYYRMKKQPEKVKFYQDRLKTIQ
jgi:hypothetical protein